MVGTDGFHDEAHQQAPRAQACIVGRAVIYSVLGVPAVVYIVGFEPEVLVSIPKFGAAVRVRAIDADPSVVSAFGPARQVGPPAT
eukprot:5782725-Lingulodinium_polyedra.AAC.1